jgi:hypothetical protein
VLLCPPPQMDSTPERQGVRQGNRDSRQDLQLSGSRLIALGVQCCCVVVCVVTLLRIACAARQQSPTVAPGGALADSAPAPPVRACLACLADRRACARPCASTRLELTSSLYPAHLWSAWQCMENCTCAKDKCFCVDKDQKPWPLVGTEFEKQLTQGHIGNSGKKAHCACSCDKEGLG